LPNKAKLSFKIRGEMKTFQGKDKLKQFMPTKPALQKILGTETKKKDMQKHEGKSKSY
jgi:hypothetical protein